MTEINMIDTVNIVVGNNDRTVFCANGIAALAQSISDNGLIQPITVRPIGDTGLFEIVAGERRYRAINFLGWDQVPCVVKQMSDEDAAAVMLAENVSREDIDPIDEGMAYKSRMTLFGWSVSECARRAGVSTTRVHFRIKLLGLKDDIQHLVRTGQMSIGYAQILADANLDLNRQMFAFSKLNGNPSPTIGWFRTVVGELQRQQAQMPMFEIDEYTIDIAPVKQPPQPGKDAPPTFGNTIQEVIESQISFWQRAAEAWERLGKPFKKQECEAAAFALSHIVAAL